MLAIVTLIFITQEDAILGNKRKDVGVNFKNTGPKDNISEHKAATYPTIPVEKPKVEKPAKSDINDSVPEKIHKKQSLQIATENDPKPKVPRRAATISGGDHSETPKTGDTSPRKTKDQDQKLGVKVSSSRSKNINKRHTEEPNKKNKKSPKKPHKNSKEDENIEERESFSNLHKNSSEKILSLNSPPDSTTTTTTTTDVLRVSSPRASFSPQVTFSYAGIDRTPTKAPAVESYVKYWEKLEAIATLDDNNT